MNLALLVLLGIGMRTAFPSRMAVEHFDEGVYASNIWFTQESGYHYPQRHFYAPPLLPGLIEASLVAEQILIRPGGRPSAWAVMVPSLLAGCAMPVVLWWVTRSWFGSGAALASAAMAALSDFHALYSRTALTDVLLVLWLLLAIWLSYRACERRGPPRWLLAAGAATALAWWTKYNGWLPLAILPAGFLAACIREPKVRPRIGAWAACWVAIAAVALALWSPHLYGLQEVGGYTQIAANHRQYVTGLAGWPSSFMRQAANLRHLEGVASYLGLAVAVLASAWMSGRESRNGAGHEKSRWRYLVVAAVALSAAALAAWISTAGVLLGVGLLGIGHLVLQRCGSAAGQANPASGSATAPPPLAVGLLLAWFVSLLVLTPLYHPYPRLVLPWLCAAWIASGVGVNVLLKAACRTCDREAGAGRVRLAWSVCLIVALAALAAAGPRIAQRKVPAWSARDGFSEVAEQLAERRKSGDSPDQIWLVYGEPGLFYQLRAQGLELVQPVADLKVVRPVAGATVYLVAGPHALENPQFAKQFSQARERLQLVGSFAYRPSDLMLLNLEPGQPEGVAQTSRQVRLYRALPAR